MMESRATAITSTPTGNAAPPSEDDVRKELSSKTGKSKDKGKGKGMSKVKDKGMDKEESKGKG